METDKTATILVLPVEPQPTDVILTRHIQNLFATYGEDKVRNSMKELFGMDSSKDEKKVA